ncbi:MAG: polymerase sigma-B factor [Pseudonocardiales bacterium]|nr:polymerase sigma-B factor [Pseudonocardiales bacterium]
MTTHCSATDGRGYYDKFRYLDPVLADYAGASGLDPRRAQLRRRLIVGYTPVARHIARRYAHRGEPLEDLEQVACIGLINAIDRFDPDRGHHFLAFAVPSITGEVRRHFRDRTWSVRVPRRLKDLRKAVKDIVAELSQHLDRAPKPSEIAARLQISTDEVLNVVAASHSYHARSLDEMLGSEPGAATLAERLGNPDSGFDRFTDIHSLAPLLDALSEHERCVLLMRFYANMTQTQIAQQVGVSQMQISRLLTAILTHLREAMSNDQPPCAAPAAATGSRRRQREHSRHGEPAPDGAPKSRAVGGPGERGTGAAQRPRAHGMLADPDDQETENSDDQSE